MDSSRKPMNSLFYVRLKLPLSSSLAEESSMSSVASIASVKGECGVMSKAKRASKLLDGLSDFVLTKRTKIKTGCLWERFHGGMDPNCGCKSLFLPYTCGRGSMELKQKANGDLNSHVCFESPTAAILLPCWHFCLCKPCSLACSECPICRTDIADIIFAFT